MGADFYAHAVIGVRVDPKKLSVGRKTKAFLHGYPESMNFDPDSGKALWCVDEVPAEGVQERRGDTYVAGYRVLFGTDRKTAYIALMRAETGYQKHQARVSLPNLDLNAAAKEMREKLEPLGFWDAEAFGLWAVLYCSY
jgi:hypothetical protein